MPSVEKPMEEPKTMSTHGKNKDRKNKAEATTISAPPCPHFLIKRYPPFNPFVKKI